MANLWEHLAPPLRSCYREGRWDLKRCLQRITIILSHSINRMNSTSFVTEWKKIDNLMSNSRPSATPLPTSLFWLQPHEGVTVTYRGVKINTELLHRYGSMGLQDSCSQTFLCLWPCKSISTAFGAYCFLYIPSFLPFHLIRIYPSSSRASPDAHRTLLY